MGEVLVEHFDHRGRRPLSAGRRRPSSARPAERIGHVAGDGYLDSVKLMSAPRGSIRANLPSSPPPGSSSRPWPSSRWKPRAWPSPRRRHWWHCRRCPRSGASHPRQWPPAAARRCLAWSCPSGFSFVAGDEHQARGGRHLDHSGATVAEKTEPGPDRLASGPLTVASRYEPPVAATSASTVPSPPSAIGTWSIDRAGQAARHAAASLGGLRRQTGSP